MIKRAERRGTGDGFIFAVDLVDYRLVTETEGSEASLEMAMATPEVPGRRPTEFPFFTGMSLTERRSTARAVANEREALERIGIGSDKKRASNFFFHLTRSRGCLSQYQRLEQPSAGGLRGDQADHVSHRSRRVAHHGG